MESKGFVTSQNQNFDVTKEKFLSLVKYFEALTRISFTSLYYQKVKNSKISDMTFVNLFKSKYTHLVIAGHRHI